MIQTVFSAPIVKTTNILCKYTATNKSATTSLSRVRVVHSASSGDSPSHNVTTVQTIGLVPIRGTHSTHLVTKPDINVGGNRGETTNITSKPLQARSTLSIQAVQLSSPPRCRTANAFHTPPAAVAIRSPSNGSTGALTGVTKKPFSAVASYREVDGVTRRKLELANGHIDVSNNGVEFKLRCDFLIKSLNISVSFKLLVN